MDVRGGGLAAKDRRIVKDEDYASDNDADFMEEDRPQQQQQQHQHQQAQHAQQAAGFENHVRGGTPGSGSAVSHHRLINADTMSVHIYFISSLILQFFFVILKLVHSTHHLTTTSLLGCWQAI